MMKILKKKTIYLPKSIHAICEDNFSCCTLLETINFAGSEQEWNAIDNRSKDNIPEGVTPILKPPLTAKSRFLALGPYYIVFACLSVSVFKHVIMAIEDGLDMMRTVSFAKSIFDKR